MKLAATLTLPGGDGPFPGCLLLSGSGPLDRDSNMPGQRLDIASSLAAALADAGVATLRYDKRGVGESTGDYLLASFDDETADAETQPLPVRWFRSRAIRRQSADRERLMASTTPTVAIGRQTAPAAWFRGYMTYDPSADLSTIDRPVLAITGRKDVQVDSADVATIGQLVVGRFESDTPARLTHLLRSDDEPAGVRRYGAQMQRPPDPTVIDRVTAWTVAQVG